MSSVTIDTAAQAKLAQDRANRAKRRRLFWMQQMRLWHWVSSALCLVCLIAFAGTGFTLNHASQIEAEARVVSRKAQAPAALLTALAAAPIEGKGAAPAELRSWARKALKVHIGANLVEWSADEAYIALPRPGGDAWLSLDRQTGAAEYELTSRGPVALLNDLHKGRNAGKAWGLFIDVFALACLVFSLTGLFLLYLHAQMRPITWPLVAAGLVIPLLLVVVFLHL